MSELTIEQKIIRYLAETGGLTQVGEIAEALRNPKYAEYLVTGDGLMDEIGEIGLGGECNHEPLNTEEIDEVFDNDEEESSN